MADEFDRQAIAGVVNLAREVGLDVNADDVQIIDDVPCIDGVDAYEWILVVGGTEQEEA
jgi:hypothetical protein